MSIKQRIDAQTDALSALLTYANEATQAGDTDIGEAIRTLVDGYGQGGGSGIVEIPTTIIRDSYYTTSGAIASYRTWSRCEPISCAGYKAILFLISGAFSGGYYRAYKDGAQSAVNAQASIQSAGMFLFDANRLDEVGVSGETVNLTWCRAFGIKIS